MQAQSLRGQIPPGHATCRPSVSHDGAGSHRTPRHPAVAHPASIWPGRRGQVAALSSPGA